MEALQSRSSNNEQKEEKNNYDLIEKKPIHTLIELYLNTLQCVKKKKKVSKRAERLEHLPNG